MGRFSVEVELANHEDVVRAKDGTIHAKDVRRIRVQGLVDTGASYLVLPKQVAEELGVPVVGKARVRYADRRKEVRTLVGDVEVSLLGRQDTFRAIIEPKRDDALIGVIVLEALDLLVDPGEERLLPRDPSGIIAELE